MKWLLVPAVIVIAMGDAAAAEPVKDKSIAPAFSARTIEGRHVRLSDLKGKVVLLDFGAVNCPPCRLEMPILESWHRRYRGRGLIIVGLMEMNPTARQVKVMLKERGITYPVAIDTSERIGKRYGLVAHPTTVLIDRRGRIVKAETGYVRGDEKAMEAALLPLLQPKQSVPSPRRRTSHTSTGFQPGVTHQPGTTDSLGQSAARTRS